MVRFNSGEFRTKITICQMSQDTNDFGIVTLKPTIIRKTGAKVKHSKSFETLAEISVMQSTSLFYMRYFKLDDHTLDNDLYIVIGDDITNRNKMYNVEFINNIEERNRYYEFRARKVGEVKDGN